MFLLVPSGCQVVMTWWQICLSFDLILHQWAIHAILYSEILKLIFAVGTSHYSIRSLLYHWHHLMKSWGEKKDRQSFNHSKGSEAPGGNGWGSSGKCYSMIQHRKKHISNLVLGLLSFSLLLGLVCSLIGWHIFMCRLSQRPPLYVILAFYYHHLFNGVGGSMAENVQPVWIHHQQRLNQTKNSTKNGPGIGFNPRPFPLHGDSFCMSWCSFFIHLSRWDSYILEQVIKENLIQLVPLTVLSN